MMNRSTRRGLSTALVLFAVLGVSSAAHAASEQDRKAAREQLTQAQDLKKQGQLADALTHFQQSQQLDPKLTTLMELADCEEQLGKLVDELPQSKAKAEQRRAAVDKRLAHLTLQLAADAPPNTQVFRDDAPLEASSLGTPLVASPGDHVIVVKAPERKDAKYDIKLAEGDSQTLAIAAGASNAPPPPPPPPKPAPVVVSTPKDLGSSGSGSTQHTIGLVTSAVGVIGVGAGSYFWYVGYRDGNSIGPTADDNLLLGQIGVIGGGALLVTGIVLLATAPSGDATKSGRLRFTPTLSVGQRATVLGAAGEF